jgi:hypothetical protein
MTVKQILNYEKKPLLNIADVSGNALVCRIELTHKEAEAIMKSLMTTNCNGEQLTVSIELEDNLLEVVKNYR